MQITLFPKTINLHLSQVLAGLFELHSTGEVKLTVSNLPSPIDNVDQTHLLWVEVLNLHASRPTRICFDMRDNHGTCVGPLEQCDIYFKRCLSNNSLQGLGNDLTCKIHPYGLNYACASTQQHWRWVYMKMLRIVAQKSNTNSSRKIIKNLLFWLGWYRNPQTGDLARNFHEFGAQQTVPANKIVLFTRLWDPQDTQMPRAELTVLNEIRIDLVRLLRQEFGELFIGGILPSAYAKKLIPTEVIAEPIHQKEFLALVKRNLIGVTTTGLHASLGWRLGEYVAASRCIVTEPLTCTLPSPLNEAEHILGFTSPRECVCQLVYRLLEQPDLEQLRCATPTQIIMSVNYNLQLWSASDWQKLWPINRSNGRYLICDPFALLILVIKLGFQRERII